MSIVTVLRHSALATPKEKQPPESRGLAGTLVLYRYVSWLITSVFYLSEPVPTVAVTFKFGVVVALLLASSITIKAYHGVKDNSRGRMLLIALEALGLAFLLVPTGGLLSPFMWYALNPIFLASRESSPYYCWIVLAGFLIAASYGTTALEADNPLQVLSGQRGVVLVYLLLTVAARMMTQLVKRLEDAFASSQRLVEHISALYQALEACSSGDNPTGLAGVLAAFAARLTDSPLGFCYLALDPSPVIEIHDPYMTASPEEIKVAIGHTFQAETDHSAYSETYIAEQDLLLLPVRSPSLRYGLIGFKPNPLNRCSRVSRSARFLAELAAISVERWHTDQLSTRLRVVEEQNRIANEIHDGVSQHLFGMVCALHNLSQKPSCSSIRPELDMLMRTARTASSELRACIYSISPQKRGEKPFTDSVKSYLDDVASLNGVQICVNVEGSEDAMSPAARQAFYRIIKEATGNAIRHGHCHAISVSLKMHPDRMSVIVKDDGIGFDASLNHSQGLGLSNMKGLMTTLGGEFCIESQEGLGTIVICRIPKGLVEGVRA